MDVMIDIEGLGQTPNGVVLSIGAIRFDFKHLDVNEITTFYTPVNMKNQNRTIDPATVEWWFRQEKAAQDALLKKPRMTLREALAALATFIQKGDKVWANGANYDLVHLVDAYKQYGMVVPWHPGLERCMRSVRDIGDEIGIPYREYKANWPGVMHDALVDATMQANYVTKVISKARGD